MPNVSENQDIAYQPKIKGYSYSNSNPQNINNKKQTNTFITLSLVFFVFLFFILIFLLVLNYFNIISLNSINPTLLSRLPHISNNEHVVLQKQINSTTPKFSDEKPVYMADIKAWKAKGTLYKFNDNQIEIKTADTILKLEFSSKDSMFYKSVPGFDSKSVTKIDLIPYTLYDLDKQENLGKKVEVYYTLDKTGKNIIRAITLQN